MKNQYVNEDVLRIFPCTVGKGRVVIDEKCQCGHFRSHHAGINFAAGHGKCCVDDCGCKKFTWTGNVMKGKKS